MIAKLFKQSKWGRRAFFWVAGILILWGVGWLLLPPIAKSQLERLASAQLGRPVSVGALDFKPWSLELTIRDLTIGRTDGLVDSPQQLQVKRIYMDIELQSLLRLAPVVDAFEIDAPQLQLTHLGGGRYDIDDILARLNASRSDAVQKPDDSPMGFALYNLAMSQGSVDFHDKSTGRAHELRELRISVPFLSNLSSQRTVLVQPHVAFSLNGSQFDTNAQGTPFAQTHKAEVTLKVANLDLTPYIGYVPQGLPVQLKSAVLNADCKLAFEQAPRTTIRLTGLVQLNQVKLVNTPSGTSGANELPSKEAELLSFDGLKLTLADVRPLDRVAHLSGVELTRPVLGVHRNKRGDINLETLLGTSTSGKGVAANNKSSAPGVSGQDGSNGNWDLNLAKVSVSGAGLDWRDDSSTPAAHLVLRDLNFKASDFAWPWVRSMPFEGSAELAQGASSADGQVTPSGDVARLRFNGSATPQRAAVKAVVEALPLTFVGPYLAQILTPSVKGTVNGALGVEWTAQVKDGSAPQTTIQVEQLSLNNFGLTQGKKNLASIQQLVVEGAQVNLDRQTLGLGKLLVTEPKMLVGREADGRWMFESWLRTASGQAKVDRDGRVAKKSVASEKSWGVSVDELAVEHGQVSFMDKLPAKPVAFELSGASAQVKRFSTTSGKPFQVQVATQVRSGKSELGRVDWRGSVNLRPLSAQGMLNAVRLPAHAFEPYVADALNIELLRAEASFKGLVSYAQKMEGPAVKVSGDMTVEDLQVNTLAGAPGPQALGEELLSWKVLALRGVDLTMSPGSTTTVLVRETVLSDFFSRLILSESGRLNLQDIMKPSTPEMAPSAAVAAEKPVISLGPMSLTGGRVHFSDRFIQPNYSTNLTELTGRISAFSSLASPDGVNLADLELRGRAEGTASLEVLGKVNPLATPVVLDIKGKVRDLELPPLSPYSVRYAGYGIERGKLSVDVAYQVKPDGQLTASNNIVLNQLTFGDKVEGAPASLPVKLAVALLADRNGVIDINLPVSGSLSDPQFRIGPIVFKLILNLIAKAITAPFSLLANALGGGDELSMVGFAPGSSVLTPEAMQGLVKVAKAMENRPALKLTVVGTASLEVEQEAYRRQLLNTLLLAEKRRMAVINGQPVGAATQTTEKDEVSAAEYPVLLKAVYRRADFPKPRNLVGLLKDLPVNEMETLMLTHLSVADDAMRELAVQRGVAVRDYLMAQNLPSDRLFLGAAKAVAPEAKWAPRAELNLSVR